MPFNSLLLTCFIHDLHFGDKGHQISIDRDLKGGETILLFVIDENSNTNSTFRKDVGMKKSDKICDCIFFYSREGGPENVVCLVELKGTNIDEAAEQILSTYQHLKAKLTAQHFKKITWKAFIGVRGRSTIRVLSAENERQFRKNFTGGFDTRHSNDAFRKLIRS